VKKEKIVCSLLSTDTRYFRISALKNPSMHGLRSNSELLLAPPSTKTKKTLGDRAFTAAAPSLLEQTAV